MNFKLWFCVVCATVPCGCALNDVEAPTNTISAPKEAVATAPTSKPTSFPTSRPTATLAPAPTPKPAQGFSESQRRKIFYDLVDCEDRARQEADQLYSPYETATSNANLEENDRLTQKFKADVIRQYRLSQSQVEAINGEGLDKEWPPLTPLKSPYRD